MLLAMPTFACNSIVLLKNSPFECGEFVNMPYFFVFCAGCIEFCRFELSSSFEIDLC